MFDKPSKKSLCAPGANLIVQNYFHDCVYDTRDAIGFTLGMTSILIWIVAQLPQFISNYRNKSAEALSIFFLAEWFTGDTLNLLGCLLQGEQLPTTTFLAMYFVMSDVVMLLQYIYYTTLQKRRRRLLEHRKAKIHRQHQGAHSKPPSRRSSRRTISVEANPSISTGLLALNNNQPLCIPTPLPHDGAARPSNIYTKSSARSDDFQEPTIGTETMAEIVGGMSEEPYYPNIVVIDPQPSGRDPISSQPSLVTTSPTSGDVLTTPLLGPLPSLSEPPEKSPVASRGRPSIISLAATAATVVGTTVTLGCFGVDTPPLGQTMSASDSSTPSLSRRFLSPSPAVPLSPVAPGSSFLPFPGPLLTLFLETLGRVSSSPEGPASWDMGPLSALKHTPAHGDYAIVAGTVLGYLSTVCYLASRISQIYKNHKRKSVEGLSWIMFCLTVSANVCTGVGMLIRTANREELINQLPWLCGTFGTIALDVTIVHQTFTYTKKAVPLGHGHGQKPKHGHGPGHSHGASQESFAGVEESLGVVVYHDGAAVGHADGDVARESEASGDTSTPVVSGAACLEAPLLRSN